MQLTVRDAARLLKVPESTIYRWIRDGSIRGYKVREQYRFNRVELLEWATRRHLSVSPEIFDGEEAAQPSATLAAALAAGGIHYDVAGDDKAAVLRATVAVLPLPAEVDREFLCSMLTARQSLASTGAGDGIAIPHVRTPIVLAVSRPQVSLCFLRNPVDFGAVDGRRVFAIFVLISTTVRGHLQLLSRLAHAVQEPSFVELLKRRAGPDEIVRILQELEQQVARTGPGRTPQPPATGGGG